MSGSSTRVLRAIACAGVVLGAFAADAQMPPPSTSAVETRYGFGTTPSPDELARFYAIAPDGRGLPAGSGSYARGRAVYAERCAGCHGAKLEGWSNGMMMPPELAAMGDGRLIGGRGSLRTANPVFTVESFWPYATTLWDYIKRSMPQYAPGSLSDADVYALVAFLLGEADIISKSAVLNERTLPKIVMPNRDGIVEGGRPQYDPSRPVPPSTSPSSGERVPTMAPNPMR